MLLGKKKKNIVGLDIGSSAVKLVELRRGRGERMTLVHAGLAHLSPEVIVEGTVMDSSLVVEVASRLLSERGVKSQHFGVSLAGMNVAIRKIQVPAMSEAELAESIHWEAEQYLPFDVNEANLDYVVLESGPETMTVLVVAAKRERVADYTSIVTQLGKTPSLVDLDAFAVQNAYEYNYGSPQDRVVALVNVGAYLTNVSILARGQAIFWRDLVFGGNNFTEAIQRELHITRDQAEAIKTGEKVGDVAPQTVYGIVNAVAQDFADELKRTFEFFYTTSAHDRLEEIVLSGGSAQLLNLDQVLRDRFSVPVEIMNPFKEIIYSETEFPPEWLNRHAPAMAVAVGMALRTVGD